MTEKLLSILYNETITLSLKKSYHQTLKLKSTTARENNSHGSHRSASCWLPLRVVPFKEHLGLIHAIRCLASSPCHRAPQGISKTSPRSRTLPSRTCYSCPLASQCYSVGPKAPRLDFCSIAPHLLGSRRYPTVSSTSRYPTVSSMLRYPTISVIFSIFVYKYLYKIQ